MSAVNGIGGGPQSAIVSATTQKARPTSPLDVTAVSGPDPGAITLRWAPPSFDGGSPVTAYLVERADAPEGPYGVVATTDSDARAFGDSGLPRATTPWYRVTARNAIGDSAPSTVATGVTFAQASPPQTPAAAGGEGEILVTWTPPSKDGGTPVTGYRILRSASATGPFTVIATVDAATLAYRDTGLGPSEAWFYRMSAVNAVGGGPQSPAVHATTDA